MEHWYDQYIYRYLFNIFLQCGSDSRFFPEYPSIFVLAVFSTVHNIWSTKHHVQRKVSLYRTSQMCVISFSYWNIRLHNYIWIYANWFLLKISLHADLWIRCCLELSSALSVSNVVLLCSVLYIVNKVM